MTSPRPDKKLTLALAAAVTVAGGQAALAAETADEAPISSGPIAHFRDDDLLLFAVDLDGLTLTDSLAAYGDPDDPLIPMGELARLLDLDITISPGARKITGRLGESQRPLTVDLANGVARVGGKDVVLTSQDVAVTPGEIYIRASAVARLLPVKVAVDSGALQIKLTALEKLPIQSRLERLARLRDLRPDVETADQSLRVPNPYRWISPPAVDVSLSTARDTRPPNDPRRYDIRVAGDLARMGFQGWVGSDDNGKPSSARVLLERHSVKGGLLGPIGATSFTIGDTFTPALAVGPRSVGGRGFAFTTAPLEQQSVFNRIDLRGELPLGYDVELYVNDVLRSGQRTPVEGRYEFLGVPLVRGVNVIRIVMYGPRGEREEQTKVITVGGGQLKPGQTTVDFGVVQQDRSVVRFDEHMPTLDHDGWRVAANLARGINNDLTMIAGAAYYPVDDRTRRALLMLGARTSWRGFSVQADVAGDDGRGQALSLGVAGQPFGVSLVGRHAEYRNGFVDEANPAVQSGKPLRRHSELTIDWTATPRGRSIPLSVRGQRDEYEDGSKSIYASARTSSILANVLVSGGVDYRREKSREGVVQDDLTGVFAASTFAAYRWQLRAALDYDFMPEMRAKALTLTADRALTERTAVRFGLGHNFDGEKLTSFQAAAIFRLPQADLAISGDYSRPTDDWRIGLQLAFGLAFNPLAGHYQLTRPGVASGGSIALQSFIDTNGDGAFQKGEQPVSGVVVQGGERPVTTTINGQAFVTGVGSAPVSQVQVNLDEIDNPYVQSPPHQVEFEPRPGNVLLVPYPLTPTGEVMLRVMYRQDDGRMVGLSAVQLQVHRHGGSEPPVTGSTEFDGSVDFENLPAGAYSLDLDPEQARRLHMRLKKPVTFTVSPDGGYLADIKAEVVFDRSTDQ
ncbi:MAG: hypothetical protein ACM3W4_06660 [Ignavibacteriales bacterium]